MYYAPPDCPLEIGCQASPPLLQPGGLRARGRAIGARQNLGKGQMGSARMGSLQISCF